MKSKTTTTTDLTNAVSLQKVQMWANELRANEPDCHIFLVGTKRLFFLSTIHTLHNANTAYINKHVMFFVLVFFSQTVDLIENGSFPRAVTEANVRAFAQRLNVPEGNIYETSAQSGKGVKELFDAVAKYYKPKNGNTDTRILAADSPSGSLCSC